MRRTIITLIVVLGTYTAQAQMQYSEMYTQTRWEERLSDEDDYETIEINNDEVMVIFNWQYKSNVAIDLTGSGAKILTIAEGWTVGRDKYGDKDLYARAKAIDEQEDVYTITRFETMLLVELDGLRVTLYK